MGTIYKSGLHARPHGWYQGLHIDRGLPKSAWFAIGGAAGLALAVGAAFLVWAKHQRDHAEDEARKQIRASISQLDASVFQTGTTESIRPVNAGELMMPGMVARIYEAQSTNAKPDGGKVPDVGSFVLSVPTFQLNLHRDHAIEVSGSPIYRLNALYGAKRAGTHQFKVSFRLGDDAAADSKKREAPTAYTRCDVSAAIAGETVVRSRLSFDLERDAHLWATSELAEGTHPVEFRIQCDTADPRDRTGMERAMKVAIETRSPSDNRSELHREAFWYKAVQTQGGSRASEVIDSRMAATTTR